MKNTKHIQRILKLLLLFILAVPFVFGDNLSLSQVDAAPAGVNITGHIWSSNIGWIRLQGPNYGIQMNFANTDADPYLDTGTVDTTKKYAWSPNIGWIDFAPTGGYPSGPTHGVRMDSSGKLIGWARVCAVFSSGCSGGLANNALRGGWDGWIRMSGNQYGPTRSACKFNGYAWGSDVIGWIKFNGSTNGYGFEIDSNIVGCEQKAITNFASGENPIDGSDGTTLTWTAIPGNRYRVVNNWLGGPNAGTILTNNNQLVKPPNLFGGSTTYQLQSVNAFGDLGPVVSITVRVEYALKITCSVFPTTIDDSKLVTVNVVAENGYTPPANSANPQYRYTISFSNSGRLTDSDPLTFGPTNSNTHQWDNISFTSQGNEALRNEIITLRLTDGSGRTAQQTCAGIVNYGKREFQEIAPR